MRVESFERTGTNADCPQCGGKADPEKARRINSSRSSEAARESGDWDSPAIRPLDRPALAAKEIKKWSGKKPESGRKKGGYIGEIVFHDTYGKGLIERIASGKVYVRFSEAGVKIFDKKTCFMTHILKRYPPIVRAARDSEARVQAETKAKAEDSLQTKMRSKSHAAEKAKGSAVIGDALNETTLSKLEELKRRLDSQKGD